MTHLLYTLPTHIRHSAPHGHPENGGRITALLQGINMPDNALVMEAKTTRAAHRSHLELCHHPLYLDDLAKPVEDIRHIDADTYLRNDTYEAACHGVGGAIDSVDALLKGEALTSFIATRPAGHHALANKAMGFCFLGTAAIAAHYAKEQGARVAILDFDVHHGNGTQALVEHHPSILFASTHQFSAWPQTGHKDDTGPHGTIINKTLKSGTGHRKALEAWADILERVSLFKPDLIIASAGFDAHQHDPLGGMAWQNETFSSLGEMIGQTALTHCHGRVLSILEGGYEQSILRKGGRGYLSHLMKACEGR